MSPASTRHETEIAGLVAAAREGGEDAFHRLIEIYRRELHLHSYRILGSVHDAEDAVQDTLLRAWRALSTYQGRGSFRAWLYRIATNACLDALRRRSRRILPVDMNGASDPGDDVLPDVREPIWLEPYPSAGLRDVSVDPAARYELRESLSLAFAAALQELAPRQRAALLLRDVLGWSAAETAKALRTSTAAVNSALQRARAVIKRRRADGGLPAEASPAAHRELVDRFLRAWEAGDAEGLAELLTTDVIMTMPPSPSWYAGREAVAGFFAQRVFRGPLAGRLHLVPTEANFLPAFAVYRDDDGTGQREAFALIVLSLRDGVVDWVAGFVEPSLFALFGLSPAMPRTASPLAQDPASAPRRAASPQSIPG